MDVDDFSSKSHTLEVLPVRNQLQKVASGRFFKRKISRVEICNSRNCLNHSGEPTALTGLPRSNSGAYQQECSVHSRPQAACFTCRRTRFALGPNAMNFHSIDCQEGNHDEGG